MILTPLEQREKLFPLDLVNNPDKILLQNFKTGEVFQMQIEFIKEDYHHETNQHKTCKRT